MPNVGAVLREEITRLARKEIRSQTEALRKASVSYRRHIADLRRRVEDLERKVVHYQRLLPIHTPSQASDTRAVRYSARSLQSNRKRLGLSAADYGKLIGVSNKTVYRWESGEARPRTQQMAAYAALRTAGKNEARAQLDALKG